MGKEMLSILLNRCNRNKITILILLIVIVLIAVSLPGISRYSDSTSFYARNGQYNILLSKTPVTSCEVQALFIANDLILQKEGKTIASQGIMLNEKTDYFPTLHIQTLSKNEIVISKKIALNNAIKTGDYIDVEKNYSHKIDRYKVVGVCDYLYDITEDTNVINMPLFFVGFDENYVKYSIPTYLSLYDKSVDIVTIIDAVDIIDNYKCETRALLNGFILIALIVCDIFFLVLGYCIFQIFLDRNEIFRTIRNSGTSFDRYKKQTRLISMFSIIIYALPSIVTEAIGCIMSVKCLYVAAIFCGVMIIFWLIDAQIKDEKFRYLGVKHD